MDELEFGNLWHRLKSGEGKSYLIFLSIIIGIFLLLIYIDSIYAGSSDMPLQYGDILYHESKTMNSNLKALTERNGDWVSTDFFITRKINLFGSYIRIKDFNMNQKLWSVGWSPDGDAMGFSYYDEKSSTFRPGIMDEYGNILTCPDQESFFMYDSLPIQLIDNQRIIINIGDYSNNHLTQYNMRTCREEAEYLENAGAGSFTVSSTGWLAISQLKDNQSYLNVFDEQKNPVVSIPLKCSLQWAAWSKDGSQLLYKDCSESSSMMVNYNFLTDETTLIGEQKLSASYSPDGNRIVYHKEDGIHILDLETGQDDFLVEGSFPQWRP